MSVCVNESVEKYWLTCWIFFRTNLPSVLTTPAWDEKETVTWADKFQHFDVVLLHLRSVFFFFWIQERCTTIGNGVVTEKICGNCSWVKWVCSYIHPFFLNKRNNILLTTDWWVVHLALWRRNRSHRYTFRRLASSLACKTLASFDCPYAATLPYLFVVCIQCFTDHVCLRSWEMVNALVSGASVRSGSFIHGSLVCPRGSHTNEWSGC